MPRKRKRSKAKSKAKLVRTAARSLRVPPVKVFPKKKRDSRERTTTEYLRETLPEELEELD